jgi:hypothetical protein
MQEAAANVPAAALISLRRPLIISAVLAAVGMGVAAAFSHPVMGILFAIGLGMGLYNARAMQRSVARVISGENPTKRAIVGSSTQRLVVVTVIALALGYFLRPDGLGVFAGLAVFQLIFMANTMIPVFKERHRQ